MDDFDLAVRFERVERALVYLLRENKRDREAYPMETTEVDALLEVLDA